MENTLEISRWGFIHSSVGQAVHDIHLQIGLDEFMSGWMTSGQDCPAAGCFLKNSQIKYTLAYFSSFLSWAKYESFWVFN